MVKLEEQRAFLIIKERVQTDSEAKVDADGKNRQILTVKTMHQLCFERSYQESGRCFSCFQMRCGD